MPQFVLKTAPLSGGVLRESNPGKPFQAEMRGSTVSLPDDATDRGERAARNQSLFREINERVKDLNVSFSIVTETGEWICECANDTCVEHVPMSIAEYEAIRSEGTQFFVVPADEHVWFDVERVAARNDRYWIVEKIGGPGETAQRIDPRPDDNPLALRT